MAGMRAIFKKEIKSYFNSPVAYIVTLFFVLFSSLWFFFFQNFFTQNIASLRGFFAIMPSIFSILVPALTMRSWAEEKKSGTEELLATMPASEFSLVFGKYISTILLLLIMIVLTFPVPLCLFSFGKFDIAIIFTEYLGVLFMGFTCTAIGFLVSANSRNQISSFIISALILLFFTLISEVNRFVDLPFFIASFLNWISINYHFESFTKGLIDTRDVAYFVLLSIIFLFLTERSLVARKWR